LEPHTLPFTRRSFLYDYQVLPFAFSKKSNAMASYQIVSRVFGGWCRIFFIGVGVSDLSALLLLVAEVFRVGLPVRASLSAGS